jgi:hypothetical protein
VEHGAVLAFGAGAVVLLAGASLDGFSELGETGQLDGKSRLTLSGFFIVIPSTYQANFDGRVAQILDDPFRDRVAPRINRDLFKGGPGKRQAWRLSPRSFVKISVKVFAMTLMPLRKFEAIMSGD